MQRIEVDCTSGAVTVIEMTPEEIEDIKANSPPPALPSCVSARQFKLQLLEAGLLDLVDAWVSAQSRDVQIAYEYSGTFIKDNPVMMAGFAALGFVPQQIDAFFIAAAQL